MPKTVLRRLPALYLLTLLCFLALPLSVAADGPPPRNLQLVGDHWTPWQPPSSFPEGAQVYVIERGDTLWNLAQRFLNNAYLWPQIWELNQYILDAHWIYPGDPLVVGIVALTPEEVTQAELTGEEGPGESEEPSEGSGEPEELTTPASENLFGILSLDQAAGAPEPLGLASDIYCSGFVGDIGEEFGYSIVGSEHDNMAPQLKTLGSTSHKSSHGLYSTIDNTRVSLTTGDIVYINGGRNGGLSVGQDFVIVQARERVSHPVTGKVFGQIYGYQGRVRVVSVQDDTAIGEISQACDSVFVGDWLKPFEEEPVPLGQRTGLRPANYPRAETELKDAPVILYAKDGVVSLGQDSLVYVDRGEEDELVPGDIYTIYRLNQEGNPPVVLGELAILSVHRRSSVAKIIESRYPIYPGDLLDLK